MSCSILTLLAAIVAIGTLLYISTNKRPSSTSSLQNKSQSQRQLSQSRRKRKGKRVPLLPQFNDPKSISPRLVGSSNFPEEDRLTCLALRGQDGQWVPSEGYMYAKTTRGSPEPHTMWKWQDSAPQCPMHQLTRQDFCNSMEYHQLRRIFFLGDSLTYQMMNSFRYLMGQAGYGRGMDTGWASTTTAQIPCDVSEVIHSPFTLEILWARNDDLRDYGQEKSEGIHQPWIKLYVSNPAKTLFVANMGMHTPNHEQYVSNFDHFVETVQSLNRPLDITVYRTSVPGHANCSEHTRPLASFSDYHDFATLRQWMDIDGFNQYTKQKLASVTTAGTWLLLDVYPMTILRPDGHRKPGDNADCVHYRQPGPPDFWNHLLFSNLLDLPGSHP